jgi:putative ABC transport system substrate-binding protein
MRRRDFIGLFGGAATAWPLAARAQRAAKVPTVGLLLPGSQASYGKWVDALVRRLGELGWNEGRTVTIERRWAEGRTDRYADIAAEFTAMNIDVAFTSVTPATVALKQASSVIPIVFAGLTDPVAGGVVASLARPGGNVTGLSGQSYELGGKRLGLLTEVMPQLRRLTVMLNPSQPGAALELAQVQAAARALAVKVAAVEVRIGEDIQPAIASLKGNAQALYVVTDPLMVVNQTPIATAALEARLPTMHGLRDYVVSGGLMSYGSDVADLYRRAGDYIDKILRGIRPTALPVQQPTKFELVLNVKTAKTLGLIVPPLLLSRADEVIG